MARIQIKVPTDLIKKLDTLGNRFDDVAQKVLVAGAEPVYRKVRSNLESVIGKETKEKPRSTGLTVSKLGVSEPRLSYKGIWNIKVGFADAKAAIRANVLEYGKDGQPPKPWLKPAISASRNESKKAMREAFDREVDNM